jgi:phospholipase C
MALENRWDHIPGCKQAPYACITHLLPENIPNLAALADSFAVSDRTFAAGDAASFGAHVTLGAGTIDGFAGFNPKDGLFGVAPGPGWGCPSNRDALWGPPDDLTYQPSCVPDQQGRGPYRPSEVPYVPTIMQRVEQAGRTWHIYEGLFPTSSDTIWSICPYFYWCYHNRYDASHDSSDKDFVTAAASGTLPDLSILLPTKVTAQHNLDSMAVGDNYIGRMVAAVENSPEWDSTAVFITYDDCGCFYDHVTPPAGMGLRNPMVIVSPWAKPGYTDSVDAIQPYSMLAFVQHTFGLASLTQAVDNAYDYSDAFDFGQHPLAGVPMTTTRVSAAERERLKELRPRFEDDPT